MLHMPLSPHQSWVSILPRIILAKELTSYFLWLVQSHPFVIYHWWLLVIISHIPNDSHVDTRAGCVSSLTRVMSYLTTADYDISCCFQDIADLKVTQFGEKRENVPFMMVPQLNHHTFIFAYISNPTTLWVHYFLAKLGGNLFIMKLIFPDQPWGLRSWSPEGTRLESPRDTVSRVMVAVSSGLQTAKGSLAFFLASAHSF